MAGAEPIRIVCADCGSARVSRDAWADWDIGQQVWVLGAVFDEGFCHRCGREVGLVEVPDDGATSVAT